MKAVARAKDRRCIAAIRERDGGVHVGSLERLPLGERHWSDPEIVFAEWGYLLNDHLESVGRHSADSALEGSCQLVFRYPRTGWLRQRRGRLRGRRNGERGVAHRRRNRLRALLRCGVGGSRDFDHRRHCHEPLGTRDVVPMFLVMTSTSSSLTGPWALASAKNSWAMRRERTASRSSG